MARTHRYTAQQVIAALQQTQGMVYLAAQQLRCSPQTIMDYCKKFPSVEQAKQEERGRLLDQCELRLWAAVGRDEHWAITFALKTLGKHRGFIEQQSLEVKLHVEQIAAKVAQELGVEAQALLEEATLLLQETDRDTYGPTFSQ